MMQVLLSLMVMFAADKTPLADFEERVAAYMKIHKAAESDRGALSPTRSSKQLEDKMKSIQEGVIAARTDAKVGDIFTPPIVAEFRRIIATNLRYRPKRIRESIRSGEQVIAKVHVNGTYPAGVPLETMPPSLLTSLPRLPSELDYRLVGTTLLLRDVTANLIVDLIPNAISLR